MVGKRDSKPRTQGNGRKDKKSKPRRRKVAEQDATHRSSKQIAGCDRTLVRLPVLPDSAWRCLSFKATQLLPNYLWRKVAVDSSAALTRLRVSHVAATC